MKNANKRGVGLVLFDGLAKLTHKDVQLLFNSDKDRYIHRYAATNVK